MCFINLAITIISLLTLKSIQPVYTNTGVSNTTFVPGLTSLERPHLRYGAKRGFTIITSSCVGFNPKRYYSNTSEENERAPTPFGLSAFFTFAIGYTVNSLGKFLALIKPAVTNFKLKAASSLRSNGRPITAGLYNYNFSLLCASPLFLPASPLHLPSAYVFCNSFKFTYLMKYSTLSFEPASAILNPLIFNRFYRRGGLVRHLYFKNI